MTADLHRPLYGVLLAFLPRACINFQHLKQNYENIPFIPCKHRAHNVRLVHHSLYLTLKSSDGCKRYRRREAASIIAITPVQAWRATRRHLHDGSISVRTESDGSHYPQSPASLAPRLLHKHCCSPEATATVRTRLRLIPLESLCYWPWKVMSIFTTELHGSSQKSSANPDMKISTWFEPFEIIPPKKLYNCVKNYARWDNVRTDHFCSHKNCYMSSLF